MTPDYITAGTITVTNGSATVTGTGTDWAFPDQVSAGDTLFVDGQACPIKTVVSDTVITLQLAYAGANGTVLDYAIQPTGEKWNNTVVYNKLMHQFMARVEPGVVYGTVGAPNNLKGADGDVAIDTSAGDAFADWLFYLKKLGSWVGPTATVSLPASAQEKLDFITVTGSVNLDDISNEVAANATAIGNLPSPRTDEEIMDAVAAMIGGGSHTNLTASYNDAGNAIDFHALDDGKQANILINSGFDVWQRQVSFSAAGYTADRWFASGATSASRVTDTPSASTPYALSVTSNDWAGGIYQIVEGGATRCQNKTVTVSVWVKGPTGKTASIEILEASSSPLFTFSGAWERVEASIPITATTAANSAGGHLHVKIISSGAGTLAGGDTVIVSNAWAGIKGTSEDDPFEKVSFDVEIIRCERYYQKSYNYNVYAGQAVGVNSGQMANSAHSDGAFGLYIAFKTSMAVSSTLTIYDQPGTSGAVSHYDGAWNDGGAASVLTSAENGMYVQSNIGGSFQTSFAFVLEAEL